MTENQIVSHLSWPGVCVVGLGGHARSKLLPALEASGLRILGIVSRNPLLRIPGAQSFLTVGDALSGLPNSTLFVIATPPSIHYQQAKTVIKAGRDVFIEKPAFLSLEDAVELSTLATERDLLLVEMLMYLENTSVKYMMGELKGAPYSVKNIESRFLIPSVPHGTFRTEESFSNSLLSDMACYPLSLLALAGYDLSNLSLRNNNFDQTRPPIFSIEGNSKQTIISISVGQADQYINNLKLEFEDGNSVTCEPFFYGRIGSRTLIRSTKDGEVREEILEGNAYELMFLRTRTEWLAEQKKRLDSLVLASESLEQLGKQGGLL